MNDLDEWCEENSVIRWLVKRAELAGARHAFTMMATTKLGPPDKEALAQVEAITDLNLLYQIGGRIFTASSWTELLGPG